MKSNPIYPNDNGSSPDELVQKGSNVCCTLLCGGVWITGSKFGVTWKLSQAAVKPPESFEKGKCYVSVCEKTYDSDEETFDMKKMSAVVSEPEPVSVQDPQVVEPQVPQPQVVEPQVQETMVQETVPEPVVETVEPVKKKVVKKKDPKEV